MQDLKQRGLLGETLVVWTTEFGRTPHNDGPIGRSHHPHWDVVDAVDVLPYYEGDGAVAAWPGGAWPMEVRDRLETFLAAALALLG